MTLRLILESQGSEVRVVSARRVDMDAPASPPTTPSQAPGVYAEVRGPHDETLYQANLTTQLSPTVEVFSPDGSIQRVQAPDEKQLTVVVAPDVADAESIVVVRRSEAVETSTGQRVRSVSRDDDAVEELIRIPLSDLDT